MRQLPNREATNARTCSRRCSEATQSLVLVCAAGPSAYQWYCTHHALRGSAPAIMQRAETTSIRPPCISTHDDASELWLNLAEAASIKQSTQNTPLGRCRPGARHACSIGMPVAPAAVGRDALAALDTFLADVKHVQVLLYSRCRCVSCMRTPDQVCCGRATAGHVVNYAAAVVQRMQSLSAIT